MSETTVRHRGPQPKAGVVSAIALRDLLMAAEAFADAAEDATRMDLYDAFRRANAALRGEFVDYPRAVYEAQQTRRLQEES